MKINHLALKKAFEIIIGIQLQAVLLVPYLGGNTGLGGPPLCHSVSVNGTYWILTHIWGVREREREERVWPSSPGIKKSSTTTLCLSSQNGSSPTCCFGCPACTHKHAQVTVGAHGH